MSDQALKIALIGCGNMAAYYAHNLNKSAQADIVSCCDPSPKKLKRFQEKWDIPWGTVRWQDLLDERIDGVVNSAIDSLHEEIYRACIHKGIPLLSEKPFAVSFEVLNSLKKDSLRDHIFHINFSKRSIPAVDASRRFVTGGGLGKIHRMEIHYRQGWVLNHDYGDWKEVPSWLWRLSEKHSHHGVLGDLGSHALDLAAWYCGPPAFLTSRMNRIEKGLAQYKGKTLDSCDDALIILETREGALILAEVSRSSAGDKDSLEIRINGEKGSIILNPEESKDSYRLYLTDKKEWETMKCSGGVLKTHQHFLNALSTGSSPDAPNIRDAIQNHVTIEAAVRSAETGRGIDIDAFGKEKLNTLWTEHIRP